MEDNLINAENARNVKIYTIAIFVKNICEEFKIDCGIIGHHLINLIIMKNEAIPRVIRDISRIIYLQFNLLIYLTYSEKHIK